MNNKTMSRDNIEEAKQLVYENLGFDKGGITITDIDMSYGFFDTVNFTVRDIKYTMHYLNRVWRVSMTSDPFITGVQFV